MRPSVLLLILLFVAAALPAVVYSAADSADSTRDDNRLSIAQAPQQPKIGEQAKKTPANKQPADKQPSDKQRRMPGVTAGREAAVMAFVRQHHPELADLLVYLKGSNPQEYQSAVRDLFRASERLAQIQERDFERYELELDLWKVGSRVQLLSARLQMSRDDELVDQLRAALNEQIDLRLAILQRDRDRQADRLTKLDEQLQRIAGRRQQAVDRELKKLLDASTGNDSRPARQPQKNGQKPAANE